MQVRTGIPIMEQIVAGTLQFYHRTKPVVKERSMLNWREEKERFDRAQRQAILELAALYDRSSEQVGEKTAAVFAIHAMLLEDEELVDSVFRLISQQGVTAEYAVMMTGRTFADTFEQMDSPYMKARAADIRDLARRVLRCLMGNWRPLRLEEPVILVADSFLPSEVMEFDRNLLGLISRKGSIDSHTAQLLRAYHIPAIVDVELEEAWEGHPALMDCHDGHIYLDPEPELLNELRERYQAGGCPREYAAK